ncbi:MAG: SoxR reducing system RseC family protein [Colwellia sp.]|nr:SoxR reducing system RseC family protein [Colwellia sp.]
MMEELATVIAINDTSSEEGYSTVTVQSQIKSTCSSCKQIDSCGSGQVSKAIPQKQLNVKLITQLPVKIGDIIVLGLSEKGMLQVAWQVYLWPLLGLIIFSGLGQYLIQQGILPSELFGVFLGCLGGYLGHRLAKFWQTRSKYISALMPKILRIQTKAIKITAID